MRTNCIRAREILIGIATNSYWSFLVVFAIGVVTVVLPTACVSEQPVTESADLAIISARLIDAEDCIAGSNDGKVEICHATGETATPYVHIRVSTKACINGHASHPGDFYSDNPSCTTCTPTTCEASGANGGSLSDGCGATLDCGTCVAPKTCGARATPNVCGILPETFVSTGGMATSHGYTHVFTLTLLRDGRALAAGGLDGTTWLATAELYHPNTGTWSSTGSMSVARIGHSKRGPKRGPA